MWTKLRPGVREFLRRAADNFELWIHTAGGARGGRRTGGWCLVAECGWRRSCSWLRLAAGAGQVKGLLQMMVQASHFQPLPLHCTCCSYRPAVTDHLPADAWRLPPTSLPPHHPPPHSPSPSCLQAPAAMLLPWWSCWTPRAPTLPGASSRRASTRRQGRSQRLMCSSSGSCRWGQEAGMFGGC